MMFEFIGHLGVQVRLVIRALGLLYRSAGRWLSAWLSLLVVQGLLPAAGIYLTKLIIDDLTHQPSLAGILPELIMLAGVLIAYECAKVASHWVLAVQEELIRDSISVDVYKKSIELDLSFYNSSDYYNRLYRARAEALERPTELLEDTGAVIQNAVGLAAICGLLFPFGLMLPLLLVLSTLPLFVVVLRKSIREHAFRAEATEDKRRLVYYDSLLCDRESAAEIRLFNLGQHFIEAFQETRKKLKQKRFVLVREHGIAGLIANVFILGITGGALGWMLLRVIAGVGTLGDLVLFYQVFRQGQSAMQSLLGSIGAMYANSLYLKDFFEFLELAPRVEDSPSKSSAPKTILHGIVLEDVSFSYTDGGPLVIKNLSLNIPAGKTIAIVGENGAGKSTIINLLCRFYEPTSGRVLVDGRDIRELALEDWRSNLTALFQEPMHYDSTVRENILYGDLSRNQSTEGVQGAAYEAGADEIIHRLKGSYQALLGRWFDGGTELSLGEWKRIALARTLYREAPVVLLDEPTSSMDPWNESKWLTQFQKSMRDKTVVLVTHRFTSAAIADLIYVIKDGKIIESGDHQTLMEARGEYAAGWSVPTKRRA